ncbi:MAG: Z1 domain-containing protein [Clostridia bacterium]|nr:Z1 domain-containing protein [Clostridia bacterium]
MNNEDKNTIIDLLYGVANKAEKYTSISEKRIYYTKFLKNNLDYIDLTEEIDIDGEDVQELIADYFLKTTERSKLFEGEGYNPWLNDYKSKIKWNFYDRYERYLTNGKHWDWATVSSIKESTDIILDHMANPKTDLFFKRQGLVIGDIQSGKTANYTGLINKSLDAGYKIIIVLAGLTMDLRNQTQKRIDREVLGYDTKHNVRGDNIGVGCIKQYMVDGLTYADEVKDKGDFKKYFASHTLDPVNMTPLVAIVKKNVSVLRNLRDFLMQSQSYCYTNGKLDTPVLIIDDEVDQASVDTKNASTISEASSTNKWIRTILDGLNRYSYVGYTATPFANVFIDPDKENDLYPRDFILCLETSPKYSGIKDYFGLEKYDIDSDDLEYDDYLFEEIDDFETMFDDEKVSAQTPAVRLSESLRKAIRFFIISSSIKKARGIFGHNSMLVHIARFVKPSTTLKPLIKEYVNGLYRKIKYEYDDEVLIYKNIWEESFKEKSENRLGDHFNDDWNEIARYLESTIDSTLNNIKVVNGDSNEQIDYESSKEGEYIVIGGDKLSRGLTLEGLTTSYYYRKSKMYDSLLQMGRWFGYRDGWIDVCRVFTTKYVINDFISAGIALDKFKDDINIMYIQGKDPKEVGQKIMYSSNLIPTSYSKMRNSKKIKISFSEEVQQLISFSRKYIKNNYNTTIDFINKLSNPEIRDKKVVFKNVDVNLILDYLKKYKDCDEYSGQISINNWSNYIESVNSNGELKKWTVVISSLQKESFIFGRSNRICVGDKEYEIFKASRSLRNPGDSSKEKVLKIKTNIYPADFREVLDPKTKLYNETTHYDKTVNYPNFDSDHGLMSIYFVDLYEKEKSGNTILKNNVKKIICKKTKIVEDAISLAAPAIWFPKTKDLDKTAVEYYVNPTYYQQYLNESALGEDEDD